MTYVHPASGSTHPLHAGYGIFSIFAVFKMNANDALPIIPDQLEVLDVTLFLEDARQAGLHL